MHHAVVEKKLLMAEVLIKNKANPNIRGKKGYTPLHLAVLLKDIRMVHLLLKYGADPNIQDDKELSPMDYTVIQENYKISLILLMHGGISIPFQEIILNSLNLIKNFLINEMELHSNPESKKVKCNQYSHSKQAK